MPLPPRPDIEQLRRQAKERLRAARSGDPDAVAWLAEAGVGTSLAAAQLRLARDHGFPSWPAMHLEIARRDAIEGADPEALSRLLAARPDLAATDLTNWLDHPRGASPLGLLAMARFDTAAGVWRDVPGTGAVARVLLDAGAPVDGGPDDPETPLITAASYGDADVASVLIAAGADLEAVARPGAGGVPGGTALLHAAVFGMTEVVDVLVAAGARVGSFEVAAAVGDLSTAPSGADEDEQTRVRALVMTADHERIAMIDELVDRGTPLDAEDLVFGRHPLRLAAANGRVRSVRALLERGVDPRATDRHGRTALDHCRAGRRRVADPTEHDAVEALLR